MGKESTRETTIKKRRKTASTSETAKPIEDLYEKIVAHEEEEAKKRSTNDDAALYKETCETIRQSFAEIFRLKKLKTPESETEVANKRSDICFLITTLKRLNRTEKFRTKAVRDASHKVRQGIDSTHLQLQNLLYESDYLINEVQKCREFKSMDETIQLVSVDEFYKHSPATISRPDITKNDEHQLHLARLEWELEQRKQLSSLCHEFESKTERVAAEITKRQTRLSSLAPQLEKIIEATEPLQESLGLPINKMRQVMQLASLLPAPLYLLFSKTDAYAKVYDKGIGVQICGEEEDARQSKDSDELNDSNESDSDQDADVLEETSQRQKRHHRKTSKTQRNEEKRSRLLASHPLSIKVSVPSKMRDGPEMNLTFFYKVELHIVTVKCKIDFTETVAGVSAGDVISEQTILKELFPNDFGEDSPNVANHYQLRQHGLDNFSALLEEIGHPYQWAQRMCGLDFVKTRSGPIMPNNELSLTSVELVMKAICRRFSARIALYNQLQNIEKGVLPPIPEDLNAPSQLTCTLVQWKSITWQEYSRNESTALMIASNIVSCNDMYFQATISRGSAELIVFVSMKNDFPIQKPVYSVSLKWNGVVNHAGNCEVLRDMERAVNTNAEFDTRKGKASWLLSYQLRYIMACFDVYLEISAPEEYPMSKILFGNARGRNRRMPFRYINVAGGVFK